MNRPKRLEREEMPMADRYEPKLSVRPLADRKPAGQGGPEDDPLVELARIVSGRTTFDPGPAAKNKTVPAQGGGQSADLANDLETELLNDLQASFTSVRESFQPAPAPAPPPPAPKPAAPAQKAAQPPAPKAPPPISEVQARIEKAPKPERSTPPQRVERPAAERPAQASERVERPLPVRAERTPPALPKEPATERETPAAKQAARLSLFRPRNGGGESPDLQSAPLRPTLPAAITPTSPVRQTSSRWERPQATEERPPSEPSRFAPPRAAAAFRPEPLSLPEIEPAEQDMYADPPPLTTEEAAYEGDFNLDDYAPPPAYEEEFPPFPEEELASLSRRRSARAMIVIGALAAVVVVGAVGFFMLGSGSADNAAPPIITADAGPTKIAPEGTPAAETDPQGKLIYDRVDAGAAANESTLVTPENDEIAAIPTDESADNPISRVIIPGGPGVDGAVAAETASSIDGEDAAAAAGDDEASQIGPRKVRTVVVRPDGTIVSSEATTAEDAADPVTGSADTPATEPSASAPETPAEPPVTRGTDMEAVLNGSDGEPLPVDPDPLDTGAGSIDDGETTAAAVDAPAGTVPATEETAADPAPAEEALPLAADAEPTPAPEPPTRPAPAAPAKKPTIVATTGGPNGPIDLTPGKPAAKPAAAPAASGGGSLVQISAQRSEDAARASFKDLQTKFPKILSRYQPNIVRADLGERGIYFRVRVGPFSGADAQRLCEDLKSAGGDCIIAR